MNIVTPPKKGSKTKPYNMNMNKKDLKRLSKSQLIKLLLKRDSVKKPIPPQRTGKWENGKMGKCKTQTHSTKKR